MSAVCDLRRIASVCVASALLLAPLPTFAAPTEPPPSDAPPADAASVESPESPPAEPPEAPETDPEDKRAAAAAEFLEGSKYYELGQYPKAIEKFERAWELSNEPLLLFNLGQANWKWFDVDPDPEHLRRAKQSFENYDKRMRGSDGYDPTEIQRFIERIDEQIAKAVETADQRKERELRALEESERRRLWVERERQIVNNLNASGIALITVGSLTLVMGIAGALVRTANKIVLDNSSGGARNINLSSAEEDRRRRDQFLLGGQLAFSGFIIGGVLLPIGIALKVTGGVRERRALGRRDAPPKAEVALTHDGFKVKF
jgi:hypothetical protein